MKKENTNTANTANTANQPQKDAATPLLSNAEMLNIALDTLKQFGTISQIKAKAYKELEEKHGKKNAVAIVNECKRVLKAVIDARVADIDTEFLDYTKALNYEYARLLNIGAFEELTECIKSGYKSASDFVACCAKYVNAAGDPCKKVAYVSSDTLAVVEGYEVATINAKGVVALLYTCYHNLASAIKIQGIKKGLSSMCASKVVNTYKVVNAYHIVKDKDNQKYIKGEQMQDGNLKAYANRSFGSVVKVDENGKYMTLSAFNKVSE